MPTETAIVVVGIVLVFAVFAAALAWTDYYTRNFRAPGAAYFEPERKFTACESGSNFMGAFLFRCPNTGLHVQAWSEEVAPSDNLYEPLSCPV